jgi:hypothetical protein
MPLGFEIRLGRVTQWSVYDEKSYGFSHEPDRHLRTKSRYISDQNDVTGPFKRLAPIS